MTPPTGGAGEAVEAVCGRITAYLATGGLFNPEMANHDAVRDLLIDARATLQFVDSPAFRAAVVREDRERFATAHVGSDVDCGMRDFIVTCAPEELADYLARYHEVAVAEAQARGGKRPQGGLRD